MSKIIHAAELIVLSDARALERCLLNWVDSVDAVRSRQESIMAITALYAFYDAEVPANDDAAYLTLIDKDDQ